MMKCHRETMRSHMRGHASRHGNHQTRLLSRHGRLWGSVGQSGGMWGVNNKSLRMVRGLKYIICHKSAFISLIKPFGIFSTELIPLSWYDRMSEM